MTIIGQVAHGGNNIISLGKGSCPQPPPRYIAPIFIPTAPQVWIQFSFCIITTIVGAIVGATIRYIIGASTPGPSSFATLLTVRFSGKLPPGLR